MNSKELLRLQLRHLRIVTWERLQDLGNLFVPIFITSGLVIGCVKFWWFVL